MIKCLIAYAKYFREVKRLTGLQKAEAYSEPKRAYTMEFFVNIITAYFFSQMFDWVIGLRKY